MRSLRLALRQVRYENRAFWRNPPAAFFTVFFPLMFLVIFNLLFGNNELELPQGIVHTSTFYVPAIAALAVISASYTNIAIGVSFSRDQGLLKRTRGTPLPGWAFLLGRIIHTTLIALLVVVVVTAAGRLFYDVDVPTNTMPAFLVAVAVGAATFSVLGLAMTAAIPNADASPAIVNAVILPLLFISDVFIPSQEGAEWLTNVADIFPVRHFSLALQTAFNPFEAGAAFEWAHLGVMAAWAVAGLLVAVRTFSWEPRR